MKRCFLVQLGADRFPQLSQLWEPSLDLLGEHQVAVGDDLELPPLARDERQR